MVQLTPIRANNCLSQQMICLLGQHLKFRIRKSFTSSGSRLPYNSSSFQCIDSTADEADAVDGDAAGDLVMSCMQNIKAIASMKITKVKANANKNMRHELWNRIPVIGTRDEAAKMIAIMRNFLSDDLLLLLLLFGELLARESRSCVTCCDVLLPKLK